MERLIFGVQNYLQDKEVIPEIVGRQFVLFPETLIKFPIIPDLNDIE